MRVIYTANEARRFSIRHRTPMKAVVEDYPEFKAVPVPDLRASLEWYCRDRRVMLRRFALAGEPLTP